jgi:hypothetical protein
MDNNNLNQVITTYSTWLITTFSAQTKMKTKTEACINPSLGQVQKYGRIKSPNTILTMSYW